MVPDLQGLTAYPGVRDTHSNEQGSRADNKKCHRPVGRTLRREGLLTGDGSVRRSWEELALVGGEELEGEVPQRVKDLGSQRMSNGEKNLRWSRRENVPFTAPSLCSAYPKPV